MTSEARTVNEYLQSLPADRRAALTAVPLDVIGQVIARTPVRKYIAAVETAL